MSLEQAITNLVSRLDKVVTRLENVERQLAHAGAGSASSQSAPSSSTAGGDANSAAAQDYSSLIDQYIKPYVQLSAKIGSDVKEHSEMFQQAVQMQLNLIRLVSVSKKPSEAEFAKLLQPLNDVAQKIIQFKDKNRTSKNFNHLSAVAEGVPALGWVGVSPTPGPFVAEMKASSQFWSDKILKEFKGKDQGQVDWVNAFQGFLKDLQPFIKQHHTTGLSWNARGQDVGSASIGASSSSSAPPPPSGGVPPPPGPPPPPPPMDFTTTTSTSSGSSGPDMGGVFAELNKGEAVTSGLKKVTADMKSKNRADKTSILTAQQLEELEQKKSKSSKSSSTSAAVSKPPKMALEGQKWVIEYQNGNKSLVIENPEPRQTVYIYRCVNSTVQIKGKVNSISVDECKKTGVVFENAIGQCEVVNCTSVEVQVTGKVPAFTIDKTSGCQLYLSQAALDSEIVTSKSSEMNVLIPSGDDVIELAIPEQYRSVIKDGKLVTEISSHV